MAGEDTVDATKDLDEKSTVWYFAYGSMVNPISKRRRGVVPSESYPARLPGYALTFGGTNGMANIIAGPEATMQGVVHKVTQQEWDTLKEVEGMYGVTPVTVHPYDPENPSETLPPIEAQAFIIPFRADSKDAPPSERYLDIITQGLQHYKVDPKFVAWVGAQPHTPRKPPSQYATAALPTPLEDLPAWSAQQLAAWRDRIDQGGVTHFAIGRKVLRVEGLPAAPGAKLTDPALHPYAAMMLRYLAGREIAFTMCMNLYEPRLPALESPEDVTAEHLAWAEDFVCSGMAPMGITATVVGRYEPGAADGDTAAAPGVAAPPPTGEGADAVVDGAALAEEEAEAHAAAEH